MRIKGFRMQPPLDEAPFIYKIHFRTEALKDRGKRVE